MAASSSYPTRSSDRARNAATQIPTTFRTSPGGAGAPGGNGGTYVDKQINNYNTIPSPVSTLFHVTTEVSLVSPRSEGLGVFFVVYNYFLNAPTLTASQSNLITSFTIENADNVPRTIKAYALDLGPSKDGPWTRLCPLSLSTGVLFFGNNTSALTEFDIWTNSLERQIGQPISPHSTVRGWSLWEYPANLPAFPANVFRFEIRDAANIITFAIIESDINQRELGEGMPLKPVYNRVNLSHHAFRLWDQCR
jgi:hypothetical protein